MEYCIGLDLGQRLDYSALVVLERVVITERVRNLVTYGFDVTEELRLGVVHTERIPLETPYPQVAARAAAVAKNCASLGKCLMGVDVTGAGAPVWDMLREQDVGKCWMLPVLMTGGEQGRWANQRYLVPKQDLVAGVVRVLEEGRLYTAAGLDVNDLVREMRGFGVKLSAGGHESFEGKKDDLVMALCLAVWASGMAGMGKGEMAPPGTPLGW